MDGDLIKREVRDEDNNLLNISGAMEISSETLFECEVVRAYIANDVNWDDDTCSVQVIGESFIFDNIPLLLHTDRGYRKRLRKGESFPDANSLFEHAAKIFYEKKPLIEDHEVVEVLAKKKPPDQIGTGSKYSKIFCVLYMQKEEIGLGPVNDRYNRTKRIFMEVSLIPGESTPRRRVLFDLETGDIMKIADKTATHQIIADTYECGYSDFEYWKTARGAIRIDKNSDFQQDLRDHYAASEPITLLNADGHGNYPAYACRFNGCGTGDPCSDDDAWICDVGDCFSNSPSYSKGHCLCFTDETFDQTFTSISGGWKKDWNYIGKNYMAIRAYNTVYSRAGSMSGLETLFRGGNEENFRLEKKRSKFFSNRSGFNFEYNFDINTSCDVVAHYVYQNNTTHAYCSGTSRIGLANGQLSTYSIDIDYYSDLSGYTWLKHTIGSVDPFYVGALLDENFFSECAFIVACMPIVTLEWHDREYTNASLTLDKIIWGKYSYVKSGFENPTQNLIDNIQSVMQSLWLKQIDMNGNPPNHLDGQFYPSPCYIIEYDMLDDILPPA